MTKGNYAVVLDLATGGCEVRKLDAQAEPPLSTKVLDVYETQKAADSAKETSAKCQSNSHQGDSARTVAHIHAAEIAKLGRERATQLWSACFPTWCPASPNRRSMLTA